MLKQRLIPVVLMRGGVVVQSKGFQRYQRLGNPTTIVQRLSDWASDELIYLDISREGTYDLGRDDLGGANRGDPLAILRDVAKQCFMPLAFGGGIRTLDDIRVRIRLGADKVVINTQPLIEPAFIDAAAREFGRNVSWFASTRSGPTASNGESSQPAAAPARAVRQPTGPAKRPTAARARS